MACICLPLPWWAVGTLISATWILSANSWMQTPQGFTIGENGQFLPADWWKIIFNPSFPYRLVHTVLAAFLTTAFGVGAVGAYHLLRDKSNRQARVMFSMAMWIAALVTPIQIFVGDLHGINTLEHQPAKIAAMEGHYETHRGAPLILFGIPDDEAEVTKYAVEIPRLSSLILTHSLDGEIKGLKEWNKNNRPKALIPFITFRVMVGLGVLMLWRCLRVGTRPKWAASPIRSMASCARPIVSHPSRCQPSARRSSLLSSSTSWCSGLASFICCG